MLADHTLWHVVLKDKASIAIAIWLFLYPKIPFDASIRGDLGSVPRVCQHPKGILADHTLWHVVLKDKASIAIAIWLFLYPKIPFDASIRGFWGTKKAVKHSLHGFTLG